MLDQHRHQPPITDNSAQAKPTASLVKWIYLRTGLKLARIGTRLRGNDLHILLEDPACPDPALVLPALKQVLGPDVLKQLLQPEAPQVYRVIVYGRQMGEERPHWTEAFYLNPLVSAETGNVAPPETLPDTNFSSQIAPIHPPVSRLAQLGQPEAIARYLSQVLSGMGVAVKAKVEGEEGALRRLFIFCESAYSPDLLTLTEPLAQHLRELELEGFRDAIVLGQVSGEPRPEWLLRVDLTPTDEILREWARWGDLQAITQWLNHLLKPHQIQVTALLKDTTLHLSCVAIPAAVPDKLTVLTTLSPALDTLAPRGITGATMYGVAEHTTDESLPSPEWIHWLDLPAASQPELAHPTLALAKEGNLEAIAFLLTRLLNPDLNAVLATGGVRVKLRQKGDLLHVMVEAPKCPSQGEVGAAIARFLKPLEIDDLTGVRVYGRRAGQKQPLWSYGVDFAPRSRLVPEAAPEFAVSDAYVGDLLSPPGALVLRSDLPQSDWQSLLTRWLATVIGGVQRSLLRTQLFVPTEDSLDTDIPSSALVPLVQSSASRGWKVAAVWGTVGLLLVVQGDWILGQILKPPSPPATPQPSAELDSATVRRSPSPPLPNISLKQRKDSGEGFNSSGFTQAGSKTADQISSGDGSPTDPKSSSNHLAASSLRPKADPAIIQSTAYPSFNSRQLNEKVALYQNYLTEHGRPPDVLILGSSRALRGVDPSALKTFLAKQGYNGVSVFNFGINGATAQVADLVLRQVLPPDKLPKLIIFADGARAFNSGRADVTFNGIVASEGYQALVAGNPPIAGSGMAQVPPATANLTATAAPAATETEIPRLLASRYKEANRKLDQHLGFLSQIYSQRDRFKALLRNEFVALISGGNLLAALGDRTAGDLSNATSPAASASNSPGGVLTEGGLVDVDGFLPLSVRFNPVTYYQKYSRVPGDYDSDYESFDLNGKQVEAIKAMAQFAQSHQVPFVFVNLPLTNDYLDLTRKRHEEEFQQRMLSISTQLGFTYRDLMASLGNQPDYFSDPSHLNRYGAYEVSRRLAEDVMIPWQQAR
jgi:hypothetical protein